MVRAAAALSLLFGACTASTFSVEGRPCDSDGACIAGYVCNNAFVCVRPGGGGDCTHAEEIACNGIDEDCDGEDAVETGTQTNCRACGNSCSGANIVAATCDPVASGFSCKVQRCALNFVDQDGDTGNGCEHACANVDGDNICDDRDTCIDADGDGVGNGAAGNAGCAVAVSDSNDLNPKVCALTDNDTCDDCSSGRYDPANDGIDLNKNGRCHDSEPDEDGDGIGWANGDPNDGDAKICGDREAAPDGCDDCSAEEQIDCDSDGICDSNPAEAMDIDQDGYMHAVDTNDCAVTACEDIDQDGCDDCRKFATYQRSNPLDDGDIDVDRDGICADTSNNNPLRDCDDTLPTCSLPRCLTQLVQGGLNAGKAECVVRYCLASYDDPQGKSVDVVNSPYCYELTSDADTAAPPAGTTLTEALAAASPVHILFSASDGTFSIDTTVELDEGKRYVLHQRQGITLVSRVASAQGIRVSGAGSAAELHALTLEGSSSNDLVRIESSSGTKLVGNTLRSYQNRGIVLANGSEAATGAVIAFNVIGPPSSAPITGWGKGNVAIDNNIGALIYGNIFTTSTHPGLSLRKNAEATIFANSFVANGTGEALHFFGTGANGSANTCFSGNVMLGDTYLVYESQPANTWAPTSGAGACASTLNRTNDPDDPSCDDHCDATAITASDFASVSAGNPRYMCPVSPKLIDAFSNDVGPFALSRVGPLERYGASPGYPGALFRGNLPDIGAREADTALCPGP